MKLFQVLIVLAMTPYWLGNAPPVNQTGGTDLSKTVATSEESCITTLRTINTAEGSYWGGDSTKGYAGTLEQLGPANAALVDNSMSSGEKDGYTFRLVPEHTVGNRPIRHYTITARPTKRMVKDQKSFFTDETGVIRYTIRDRAPTAADSPIDSSGR